MDIDYDAISRALKVTAFWSTSPGEGGWKEEIRRPDKTGRIEVGMFNVGKASEHEELLADGRLAVIGEDRKLSKWMYSPIVEAYFSFVV